MNYYKQEVARKYARAYLNLYSQRINEDVINSIRECSKFFSHQVSGLSFIHLASVDDEVKSSAIKKIMLRYGINQLNELIGLLIEDKRIYVLSMVLDSIAILFFKRVGIMLFEVASAQALEKLEQEVIEKFLHSKTGKRIRACYVIDPSLIAGISLKSSNYKWEFSVRKELARLAAAI